MPPRKAPDKSGSQSPPNNEAGETQQVAQQEAAAEAEQGEEPSNAEDAVLRELGLSAEGASAEMDAPPAEAVVTDAAPADNHGNRRKAANARKRAQQEAKRKAKADAEAARERDHGVVQGSIQNADIPLDADGNPLWYHSRKSGRVVAANPVLNRPDIRRREQLVPCNAPERLRVQASGDE